MEYCTLIFNITIRGGFMAVPSMVTLGDILLLNNASNLSPQQCYRIVGGPPGFEVFPALYTNTTPDFLDIPDMKGLATHGL